MQSGFDYADIIDEVLERALGETTVASDVISAKRSIFFVLNDWHARQFNTWRIKVQDFITVGGLPEIGLPLELDDTLAVTSVNDAGQETPMERISETQYANLTTKATRGRPTQYMLRRTEPPFMFFTPIGADGTTYTVRVTFIKRPDQFDRYGTDLDSPARWQNALITNAALDLAMKKAERTGPTRITNLKSMASNSLAIALTDDRQRNSFKMRIG